jgi:hypothetical protein
VEGLQARELALAQLGDPLGGAQVLEAVFAEIAHAVRPQQRGGGSRDEDLAPVAGGGDPGGAVHVRADVALAGQQRRPRVEAHPHRDRERLLRFASRGERPGRGREGDEERVALSVDLDAAVPGEGLP